MGTKTTQSKTGAAILVYVDPELKQRAKVACVKNRCTWQELITTLLEDFLAEEGQG